MLRHEHFEENQRSALQVVERNATRLYRLVSQILDTNKIDGGELKLQVQQEDIAAYIKAIVESFNLLAKRKKIEYKYEADNGNTLGYFDKDKIEKIVYNLVHNAIKFTRIGGTVSVKLTCDNDFAKMEISDNGHGISEEDQSKVFDRFYQTANSQFNEGMGIGLSLVKRLVEIHKGTISLESIKSLKTEPGYTKFTIEIPIKVHYYSSAELLAEPPVGDETIELLNRGKHQEDEPSLKSTKGMPVALIVEDNDDMRKYICSSLTADFTIYQEINGTTGLSIANRISPDIIISDIMMPEMDGIEFCSQLKSNEHTSHIPIILLTAQSSIESVLDGLESGADDYITKPFSRAILRAKALNLIRNRKQLQEKFSKSIYIIPSEVTNSTLDQEFLSKCIEIIEDHLQDSSFDNDYSL